MKKTILSIACFLAGLYALQAQTLYGVTYNGGTGGAGTINKFVPALNELTVLKSFEGVARGTNYATFVQAKDGKVYSMTSQGGSNDQGVIFSYDPPTSKYTIRKHFDSTGGANPYGGLLLASDGKLYGMTAFGGSSGKGVIFSFDPSTSVYSKLMDFNDSIGTSPRGSLIQASDGKLYGMTGFGGSNDAGVIFSFDPLTFIYTKLKEFNNSDGANPTYGSLMQALDGKLYGVTRFGGISGKGVIFSYDPSTSIYAKLIDFDVANGANPWGTLIQAADGKLYGTTQSGGNGGFGIIFSVDPVTSTFMKLKDFNNTDGNSPNGFLIQASDGKLYGSTVGGGSGGFGGPGFIFSFDPSAYIYTILKEFNNTDGAKPHSGLTNAVDGKLYGVTVQGGNNGDGVIFSFDPITSNYTKLKDFNNGDGSNPVGSLVRASDGKFYGMTQKEGGGRPDTALAGPGGGAGVIYSFNLSSSTYAKLKDFYDTTALSPYGSLIQATDGKLYGITPAGGLNGFGVLFSFDPVTSIYTGLKNFFEPVRNELSPGLQGFTGVNPYGSLIQAHDGKLYGLSSGFDRYEFGDYGTIFSFDISTSTFGTQMPFRDNSSAGALPYGDLIQASDGKLYGMTSIGGSINLGIIFSFDPATSIYSPLKEFNNTDGAKPFGSLVQASDGKLYGMTNEGGSNNLGVIFSFDPATSIYTKLVDFDNTNGANPYGNLMQASDGKLYGMTYQGGSNNLGVIFSFDPSTSTFTKLQDYNGANGAHPYYGSAFIEVPECAVKTTFFKDADGDGYGSRTDSVKVCSQPSGYVTNNTDCDDTKASVHPGATEICGNGFDDNCNGQVDENCNAQPTISINDVTVNEADGKAVLTVTLSKAISKPVWILYYTKDGTAENRGRHKDYVARIGLLVIRPGSTTATIAIKIIKDNIPEPTEYFDVILVRAFNAAIEDGSGRVFITGNSYSKNEAGKSGDAFVANNLTIIAMPNPTTSQFNLVVESNDKKSPVTLKVFNMEGKLIESKYNLFPGQQLWMGGHYRPGNYVIHVMQGKQRKTIMVIKLSE